MNPMLADVPFAVDGCCTAIAAVFIVVVVIGMYKRFASDPPISHRPLHAMRI
jgi:hypothetical protein